jgi:hypothetical protein
MTRRRKKKIVVPAAIAKLWGGAPKIIKLWKDGPHQTAWHAWMRYFRQPDVKLANWAHYCETVAGYVDVPTMYPPIDDQGAE